MAATDISREKSYCLFLFNHIRNFKTDGSIIDGSQRWSEDEVPSKKPRVSVKSYSK